MSDKKSFHLGDILSITTGRLVSPRHMDGVYEILNYMTSDDLYTHALPRAAEECKPFLLEAMPWLNEIDSSNVTAENWEIWLSELVKKYGEYHPVRPLHQEDHEVIDPITELTRMGVDPSKIITIDESILEEEGIKEIRVGNLVEIIEGENEGLIGRVTDIIGDTALLATQFDDDLSYGQDPISVDIKDLKNLDL